MTDPNMTISGMNRWMDSKAYQEYKADHDSRQLSQVVGRAKRVIRGDGSEREIEKVSGFIARMKANSAGETKYGSGASAVSARTASLRNWGFDPTGRYS